MPDSLRFSLISPVFKRPEEVEEFLQSIALLEYNSFELIIGDGTPDDQLRHLREAYQNTAKYELKWIFEEYLPVSDARNRAAEVAVGEYFIFLDSDCIIPPNYLNEIDSFLKKKPLDLFGGPDAAAEDFTTLQKAISFSMTSFITTGGIRGGKKTLTTYHPRGFNMGISNAAFKQVKGYDESLKCGEDVDLSIRLLEAGFQSGLIPDAFVYHKRRTSLKKYFNQVFRFGAARIDLAKRHKGQLKLTHLFPLIFLLGSVVSILSLPWFPILFYLLITYTFAVYVFAFLDTGSLQVSVFSVITTYTMFFGYGWGMLKNGISNLIRKKSIRL